MSCREERLPNRVAAPIFWPLAISRSKYQPVHVVSIAARLSRTQAQCMWKQTNETAVLAMQLIPCALGQIELKNAETCVLLLQSLIVARHRIKASSSRLHFALEEV